MDINAIFADSGDLGLKAKAFVQAANAFFTELAKRGDHLDINIAELGKISTPVDYDAPVADAYTKQYRPVTASEIARVNKQMTEAVAGEKWVAGFIACVGLMLLFKP